MPALTFNPFTAEPSAERPAPVKTELELLDEDIARRQRAARPESKPPFLQRLATGKLGDIAMELLGGTAALVEAPAGLVAGSVAATARPFAAAGLLSREPRESIVSDLVRGRDPRPKARARARQFDVDIAPLIPPAGPQAQAVLETVSSPFEAAINDFTKLGMDREDAQLLVESLGVIAPGVFKARGAIGRGAKAGVKRVKELGQRGEVTIDLSKTDPDGVATSLKKADVRAELQELGFDEPTQAERFTFQKGVDEAAAALKVDPTRGTRLAAELLENPRALGAVEKSILLHERTRVSALREKAQARLDAAQKGGTKLEIDIAEANVNAARGEFQTVSEAALLSGTESGISLAFQKALLKRDFTLASLERQRRTVKGRELTKQELNETKALHETIEKTERKLETKVRELRETKEASRGSIKKIFEESTEPGFKLTREKEPLAKPKAKVSFEEQAAAIDAEITRLEVGKEPPDVSPQLRLKLERIKEFKLKAQRETAAAGRKSPNENRASEQLDAIETEINKIRGIKPEKVADPQQKLAFPRKALTDKQLTDRAMASLERSIKDLETRIKEKDLRPKRNVFTTPDTPELQALRTRRDALRAEMKELRRMAKDKKTPEQIALARLKTRLKNETARLQERLELKDFTQKEKIPLELDAEAAELLRAHEKAKEAFSEALFKDQLAKRSTARKIIDTGAETLNLSRAVITSLDLSAVARQGGFIGFGNPVRAAQSFPAMIRALRSEAGQAGVMAEIKGRKNAPLYKQAGLFMAERGKGMIGQEEVYMSRHVDKVPLVAASQRAYVTFLNKLRADSFDVMVQTLGKEGVVTLNEAKSIANYVNVATGRGSVVASTTALVNMNTVFFAPRLVLSRFQLLTGQPLRAASSPRVRKLITKEYGKFLIGLGTMYALGQLAGADVEVDPRSSDFGKIRFGKTRVDPLTGISQASVFSARIASGQIKGLKSGKASALTGKEARKFGNKDLFDVLATFFRTKLSPVVGTAIDLRVGKNVIGQQVTAESAAANLLTPLVIQDIFEAMKEQGVPATVALSLLAILGFGMQTFDPSKKRKEDKRGFFSAERLKEKVGIKPKRDPFKFTGDKKPQLTANPF